MIVDRYFVRCAVLLFLWVLTYSTDSLGQHEYDVWLFGNNRVVDFRPSTPRASNTGPTSGGKGNAIFGDPVTGDPMITVSGDGRVFDRNGDLMPNGNGLLTTESTQAALIIPWPCKQNLFVVVTTQQAHLGPSRGSHYSIVDLSLNNGLGDVSVKNVPLNPDTDERLTAVHFAFGDDYWILLHSNGGNSFYAYRLSKHGISKTPVVSSVGTEHGPEKSLGYLKASPNGRKLAIAGTDIRLVELFDFDPLTGVVSNPLTLFRELPQVCGGPYGLCFSPDNSKLYYTIWPHRIYQVDLSGPRAEIRKSTLAVNDTTEYLQLRQYWGAASSRKGHIYFLDAFTNSLSIIEAPNEKGRACLFRDSAVTFNTYPGTTNEMGLPNMIEGRATPTPEILFTTTTLTDTITDHEARTTIRVFSDVLRSATTVYGHYDTSSVALIEARINGASAPFTVSADTGSFEINVAKSATSIDLCFVVKFDDQVAAASFTIDSVAIAGATVSSCNDYSQSISLSNCVSPIIAKFMRNGKLGDFTLNPNPAQNSITIECAANLEEAGLEIYDQLGNRHLSLRENLRVKRTIGIGMLPAGPYYLRVTGNGFVATKPFTVIR